MKKVKLGYYCADVNPQKTGSIGIYKTTLEILRELEKQDKFEVVIILTKKNKKYFKEFKSKKVVVKSNAPYLLRKIFFYPGAANKIAKKEKLDFLFFPKGHMSLVKVKKTKYVSFVHDLIPLYYLKKGRLDLAITTALLLFSLKFSDIVLVNSNYTKKVVKKFTKNKILVVPEGCNQVPVGKIKPKKNEYIFIAGSGAPHKNMGRTLDLIKKYNKKYGTNYEPYYPDGSLSEEELAGYYKNAKFTMFLSSIEGFGLPLIESYFYETPVVFNNATSLAELGKSLPGKCNVEDDQSVFNAINEVLDLKKKDIQASRSMLLKKYNWKKCVEDITKEIVKF